MSAMNEHAYARWRAPGLMGRAIAFGIVLAMNLNAPASRMGWAEEGAKGTRQAAASDKVVRIDNFTFIPDRLVVRAGETVTWINEDDIPHVVAASNKIFRSRALDTDDKYSFTFTTPGVYEYFCSMHPHMKATIVVEAGQSR
jgi:plastocyanin